MTIHSSVSKTALKEKAQEKGAGKDHTATGAQAKNKDIEKFQLYFDFTCNVQRIQPHQVAKQILFFSFIVKPALGKTSEKVFFDAPGST